MIAFLVWMVIPEIWTKPIYLGPLPMPFIFTQILVLSLLAEGLFRRIPQCSFLWLVAGAVAYAIVRSALANDHNNWDEKYFASDLWTIQGFAAGILWARRRSLPEIATMGRVLAGVIVPAAISTIAGLYLGVIRPGDDEYSNRIHTSSLWNIGTIALFMWPILRASARLHHRRGEGRPVWDGYLRTCTTSLVPAALVIAVITTTRSLLIAALCIYVVVRCTEPKRTVGQGFAATAALVVVLCATATLATLVRVKGYTIWDRFQQTTEETRGNELSWMFEQLGNEVISGWGFGSLFYSPIRYNNRPLESAPHVGIATFVLKGGLVMVVTFVIVPLILSVRSLSGRTPKALAANGCVLVYMATACLSGGWYPYQMLLYGVGVGMLLAPKRTRPFDAFVPDLPNKIPKLFVRPA
jgi:hypothetical protein